MRTRQFHIEKLRKTLLNEVPCPLEPGFDGFRWRPLHIFGKKLTMTLTIPLMARPHEQTTRSENAIAGRLVITSRALF